MPAPATVTYAALTGLNPQAYADASGDMSRVTSTLAAEHGQYRRRVLMPLQAELAWRGGGQPHAAVVAEVNGLAVGHAAAARGDGRWRTCMPTRGSPWPNSS